ncbi:type IV secretion system DNA-binding domain-containing protein [Sphingomonas sp. TX0543]|uniref:type IV secretion system DNA-binding domain-containing protein n=1 Tax=Sphingomonas sp. TX0543 TaxID=3399682 RepID=UPI003AFA38E5
MTPSPPRPTTEKAARMAELIRSVLNVNGQALRFMPDPVPGGLPAFSIRDWIDLTIATARSCSSPARTTTSR